jgi:peptidoglycan/LPS O-acetylase OafA/YrhL
VPHIGNDVRMTGIHAPEDVRIRPPHGGDHVRPAVAVLMAAEAASLAVMSYLHLHGDIGGGAGTPFRSSAAGIAEAVIGVVLLAGALAAWRIPDRARPAVLAAVVFAIIGFVVGISITISGRSGVDIAYHATVLPILVVTLILVPPRRRRPR